MAKEIAVGKRIKINKMQQQMMLAVIGASLVFGVCLVLCGYLIKNINFNNKVIEAKDEGINNYYAAIKNVGICIDSNKDGKYTDAELEKCNPDDIDVMTIPKTLRYNIMVNMADNINLESMARAAQSSCYTTSGTKKNFVEMYQNSTTAEQRAENIYMMRMCSALRVIPDALPSLKNEEALLASLNQLFLISRWEPQSLSPGGSGAASPVKGISAIPVSLSVETDTATTLDVLRNIEKSIRSYMITSATISWSGESVNGSDTLELKASADAFYTDEVTVTEKTKTIYASDKARGK